MATNRPITQRDIERKRRDEKRAALYLLALEMRLTDPECHEVHAISLALERVADRRYPLYLEGEGR